MRTRLAVLLLALWPAACSRAEAECREVSFEGMTFTVCEAVAGADVRIFLNDADGQPFGSFDRVNRALAAEGAELAFAMNAGMYHADRRPVGLMIESGTELAPIVTAAGPGNFGLLPNGVFCVGDRFRVIESRAFAADRPDCRHASQSGPMLVIDGELHPRFLVDSDSRHVRNGVGVSADGSRAVFAISNRPVTFHEFGRFYRDALGLPDALYFDGSISRLYDAGAGRSDWGTPMGPIVGLVVPKR
ncbi:phosphodiester glycosidase family protein [Cereibacter sphaeroides]|uniref:phosphodiester glycosidase family protein n=1 Tax=Cereibacter sphaeroides TaxID=1063 RepID=UPI001F3D4638|nr:phosphodiester glycosidase family protein [Cereibacter sphaeroides]MCE6951112.1 phosphodiester glycosidase family protein [Cereibacter sphaeroides]